MDLNNFELLVGSLLTGASSYTLCSNIKKYMSEVRKQKLESYTLLPHQICIGYNDDNGYKEPIIVDFKYNPHMLVCGLSQQGKSKMVEYALQDKNVILINTFNKDYTSLKHVIERTNNTNEIVKLFEYLLSLKESESNECIYIVIDELLALSLANDKTIQPLITRLLAISAHMNIYVIGITQSCEKELIKNKHLFNTRVCFRMLDDSCYKVALGYSPNREEITQLCNRQFFYYSNNSGIGYTYDL